MHPSTSIVVLDQGRLLDGGLDWGELAGLGHLTAYPRTARDEILERSRDATILLTNKTPLDEATLDALPELRFIGVLATGHNVVDSAAARARDITVSNVPAYGTDSVAQHVFALILELSNQAGRNACEVRAGTWTRSREWCAPCTPVVELAGRRLGLIGRGRIARRVAEIGRAFGLEILMTSLSRPEGGEGLAGLADTLATADILSLHCQLTPANAGLVNRDFLHRMKPAAFLVNTARGGLVNENDLAEALTQGTIAGAALDVLATEPPPPDHPLCRLPNCLVTPHMAWMGARARRRLLDITAENVRAFLEGRPVNVVN